MLSTLCELDPLNHVVQPEAMGLGNCAYHRIELTPLPSIKPSRELLEKARKAAAPSDTAPTEPFALDEDLRIEPVELKLVAQADHLDGLVRNRTDPRTDSEAFSALFPIHSNFSESQAKPKCLQSKCTPTFKPETLALGVFKIRQKARLKSEGVALPDQTKTILMS